MKKAFLLLICGTTFYNSAIAQEFYGRLGLGYALPQAGQTMDGTATPYSGNAINSTVATVNYTSYNISKASFSSGFRGAFGVGYMFNSHIGVEGALDMTLAAKKYTFTDYNVVVNKVPSNVDITQSAPNTALFIPSLVLQTDGAVVNLYTRIGIAIPLNTRILQDQIFTNLPGTGAVQPIDYTYNIKNQFALGFSAAAGIKYTINSRMKFWGEIGFLSLAVYAKQADLTAVSVSGQGGYLSQIDPSQRTITYSANFTSTTNDYLHQPTYAQPFSNCSLSAGVCFALKNDDSRRHRGKNDVISRRR